MSVSLFLLCKYMVVFRYDPPGWRSCTSAYFGIAVDEDFFMLCSGDQLQGGAFYENNTYHRHLNIFPWENKDEGNEKMASFSYMADEYLTCSGLSLRGKKDPLQFDMLPTIAIHTQNTKRYSHPYKYHVFHYPLITVAQRPAATWNIMKT